MSAFDFLKHLFIGKPSSSDDIHSQTGMYSVASDECIGCRSCRNVCTQSCIDFSSVSAKIIPELCVNCGKCLDVCPVGAIRKTDETPSYENRLLS